MYTTSSTSHQTVVYQPLKRIFDIICSIVAIMLLAPVLLLIVIAITFESSGNPIFVQKRYGYKKQPFNIFKFRSMSNGDRSQDNRQAIRNDPRITRVGKFIRSTSLDELPQLFNVLAGSMSFVGPRPHPLWLDDDMCTKISDYDQRYDAKPGITGLAQVSGFRGETSTTTSMRYRIGYDVEYVRYNTTWLDISILFKTIAVVLNYRNTY